ncbi:hypothetical protein CC2G_001541 [Coprinopsis cinerea AmutBmut pab1-1]|nr:hypothetical protein CC2G_001541 [Coprinopsis cinerea AmutBmut pab1-1]
MPGIRRSNTGEQWRNEARRKRLSAKPQKAARAGASRKELAYHVGEGVYHFFRFSLWTEGASDAGVVLGCSCGEDGRVDGDEIDLKRLIDGVSHWAGSDELGWGGCALVRVVKLPARAKRGKGGSR